MQKQAHIFESRNMRSFLYLFILIIISIIKRIVVRWTLSPLVLVIALVKRVIRSLLSMVWIINRRMRSENIGIRIVGVRRISREGRRTVSRIF